MTKAARVAVVVSTIGRAAGVLRLAESLAASSIAGELEFVLIDQSLDQVAARVLASRRWPFHHRIGSSARGLSVGRNAGLLLTSAPVVGFPDDDAWYPARTLERVVERFASHPTLAGYCGRQLTGDGRPSMLRWRQRPGRVGRHNFVRSGISSTMFFRRSALDAVGSFDEQMGVGSSSWYGAGEESDLLLRVIESGAEVTYDPDLIVFQDDPRDAPDPDFIRKMLSYGCGQGHLWRKHNLSRQLLAYYGLRKLVAAGLRFGRGQRTLARADVAWIRGTIAGIRDVPPPGLGHVDHE